MGSYLWVLFAGGAAFCWGAYGPTIHEGTTSLKGQWKTFLCVGVAYFVIAVLGPALMIPLSSEDFRFNARGVTYGLIGGALGALGALCVIAAMKSGGKPFYVMPLIFGFAPIVNVAVSAMLHPPTKGTSPFLYAGIGLLAAGAGLVLYFKPQ